MLQRLIRSALLLILFASQAEAQTYVPPKLTSYATDLTGTLSRNEIGALNGKLEAFAKETSTQVVVLMVPSIGDTPLEEASQLTAQSIGIGQKGKNNGVLLFVSKGERKVRIEVGYGLEGALPDITSGTIIRKEIVPQFREGDYYAGLSAGVDAIILATKNEYKADEKTGRGKGMPMGVIIALVIVFMILGRIFRGPFGGSGIGRRGGMIFFPPIGGGMWRWGSGGGGFGGGGFSGGGGSFGGGGASGSW